MQTEEKMMAVSAVDVRDLFRWLRRISFYLLDKDFAQKTLLLKNKKKFLHEITAKRRLIYSTEPDRFSQFLSAQRVQCLYRSLLKLRLHI